MSQDLYARQKLLPEVGDAGQELLGQARVLVPLGYAGALGDSDAAEADAAEAEHAAHVLETRAPAVAADYLRRAGVGVVTFGEGTLDFPHTHLFRHAASGELAGGAWFALDQLRRLLSASRAS